MYDEMLCLGYRSSMSMDGAVRSMGLSGGCNGAVDGLFRGPNKYNSAANATRRTHLSSTKYHIRDSVKCMRLVMIARRRPPALLMKRLMGVPIRCTRGEHPSR